MNINTKFNLGDDVYYFSEDDNIINVDSIESINIVVNGLEEDNEISYNLSSGYTDVLEEDLFTDIDLFLANIKEILMRW